MSRRSRGRTYAGPHASGFARVLVAVAFIFVAPAAASGNDLIILRDGGVKNGRLIGCTEKACTLDGSLIPRQTIQTIGLNGARPPPPPMKDPAHDEIRLVDAAVHRSRLVRIDAATVITANATHARKRVAWIHLARQIAGAPGDRGSTGGETSPSGRDAGTSKSSQAPPWFGSSGKCDLTRTTSTSWGVGLVYGADGKSLGTLPAGQITCALSYTICGDSFFSQTVINANKGERCPPSLHSSSAPPTYVCCAKWREAKRTNQPCNPLADSDCDGVPNSADDFPLDASRTSK